MWAPFDPRWIDSVSAHATGAIVLVGPFIVAP